MTSPTMTVGFVPSAPLLVPQVAGGSAAVDDDLRDACREVARRLCEQPGPLSVIAAGAERSWSDAATWGFEGFGIPRQPPDDRVRLPWQLGIGAWLLDDVGYAGERRYLGLDALPDDLAEAGALLVVGDGTARRTEKAPGHLDERAAAFDAAVAAAISAGDIDVLAGLDLALAAELMCAGAPVWRAVANRLAVRSVRDAALLIDSAPYGVGYFAGWWQLAERV